MPIKFKKMDACGNNFIAITEDEFRKIDNPYLFAIEVCDSRKYIGADGLIVPIKEQKYDFRFKYISYLGKDVPFCGHAIRCLTLFSYYEGYSKNKEMHILTEVGIKKTIIKDISDYRAFIGLEFENFEIPVKHYVKRVDNAENYDIKENAIEFFKNSDEHFNVYSEIESGKILVRTWEYKRDREEFSCATGGLACALNYNKDKKLNWIEVIPKSKMPIYIEILKDKAILWSDVKIVLQGEIYELINL